MSNLNFISRASAEIWIRSLGLTRNLFRVTWPSLFGPLPQVLTEEALSVLLAHTDAQVGVAGEVSLSGELVGYLSTWTGTYEANFWTEECMVDFLGADEESIT